MSEFDAPRRGKSDAAGTPMAIGRLKRRSEFQRAAQGARFHSEAFVLQAARQAEPASGPRVGFTATRKIGGAVERNRIRRRLKEALRLAEKLETRADHDYVLIARRTAISRPFDRLCADLARAFATVHAKGPRAAGDRDRPR